MSTTYLIRNKGTEECRERQALDPQRLSYEQKKAREDSQKYREIIQATRARLGLAVPHA